jgi:hypothetical protein
MLIRSSTLLLTVLVFSTPSLLANDRTNPVRRDPQAIEILTRTVNAAGGFQSFSNVRDLTESGEITFNWGEDVKGPVTIRTLGDNHFRMEADLPRNRMTWVVRNGMGFKKEKEDDTPVPISTLQAINLAGFTFPLQLVAEALADPSTDLSFVAIEHRGGRSVYRLRMKGRFGSVSQPHGGLVVKSLLVDALNFDIVIEEDYPFLISKSGGNKSDTAPRQIEFEDFRVVDGVRVPFSISTRIVGQRTMSISLSKVIFNSNLSDSDFRN